MQKSWKTETGMDGPDGSVTSLNGKGWRGMASAKKLCKNGLKEKHRIMFMSDELEKLTSNYFKEYFLTCLGKQQ
jgi:hypothetical protein